jgi:hypothetical protein
VLADEAAGAALDLGEQENVFAVSHGYWPQDSAWHRQSRCE